jgi:hypothetical protein
MGMRLEAATSNHAELVERAFLREMNPRMPSERWRRLFQSRWGASERPLGSLLFDDDCLVGYAGFVHGRLPRANGDDAWLCNISSWVTAPAYASQALALVMPALKLAATTVTNLTPILSVHAIFSRLGFETLETSTVLLYPAALRTVGWNVRARERALTRILPLLPAWEARIAEDHADLVRHLWLGSSNGQHCYVQYQMTRRRKLPAAKVLWVTPGAMPSASLALRHALLRDSGAVFVELESRMAGTPQPPASWKLPLPQPQLFRPTGLTAAEVPSVYSEVPLLEV